MLEREFCYKNKPKYKFVIGSRIASALSGFIVGFIVAAMILIPIILWMR